MLVSVSRSSVTDLFPMTTTHLARLHDQESMGLLAKDLRTDLDSPTNAIVMHFKQNAAIAFIIIVLKQLLIEKYV